MAQIIAFTPRAPRLPELPAIARSVDGIDELVAQLYELHTIARPGQLAAVRHVINRYLTTARASRQGGA